MDNFIAKRVSSGITPTCEAEVRCADEALQQIAHLLHRAAALVAPNSLFSMRDIMAQSAHQTMLACVEAGDDWLLKLFRDSDTKQIAENEERANALARSVVAQFYANPLDDAALAIKSIILRERVKAAREGMLMSIKNMESLP